MNHLPSTESCRGEQVRLVVGSVTTVDGRNPAPLGMYSMRTFPHSQVLSQTVPAVAAVMNSSEFA